MSKEISNKRIIGASILIILLFVMLNLGFSRIDFNKFNIVEKALKKLAISQNISPQRLFVKTWRISRNSYIDKTMNGQNWTKWRLRYTGRIKTIEDADVAINTMLLSLNDPYTKFLRSDAFSAKMMIIDSKITGIGLMINKSDDGIVVNHILENSPAYNANIIAGDTIVSINGESAKGNDIDSLMESIETGRIKKVEITIKRNNQLITKELVAKDIPIKTMNYRITKDNIGIITLSNIMGKKAIEDFKYILAQTNNADAVVIDLRNNYGGLVTNAIEMANYMLDIDKIVSIDSRINKKYQIYSMGERIFKPKPVVILINKNTASAAEIFAGALKDNVNAVLVGENSFGKNAIQKVIPLANKTGLIITTDKYILPNGNDIHNTGLTPDIYLSDRKNARDDVMTEGIKIAKELVKNQK